jgi:hypothetical protein
MVITINKQGSRQDAGECLTYGTLARTDGRVEPDDCHIMSPCHPLLTIKPRHSVVMGRAPDPIIAGYAAGPWALHPPQSRSTERQF